MTPDPLIESARSVSDDLRLLATAYSRNETSGSGATVSESAQPALRRNLLLCDALVRNIIARRNPANRPQALQVAVFGGTQVGKSTVVNLLAGRELARVHHTAGFTRHAQAFLPSGIGTEDLDQSTPLAWPGYRRVTRDALSPACLEEYSITETSLEFACGQMVPWDSPDCDAVDSEAYLEGLVEAVTAAGGIVYVTSREKYAVNHILDWIATLGETGIPIISCLNMTPKNQQEEILTDMARALGEVASRHGKQPPAPVPAVAITYAPGGGLSDLLSGDPEAVASLRSAVTGILSRHPASSDIPKNRAFDFIRESLPAILEPAKRELDAVSQWEGQIARVLDEFADDYRRHYLDDPHRYDAFNRVGLEILALLNPPVPGLQRALTVTRTMLSLPARALISGGRAIWNFARSGGQSITREARRPFEVSAFHNAHARLLNSLSGFIDRKNRQPESSRTAFWNVLDQQWKEPRPEIEKEFEIQLARHRERTDEWIRTAAHEIYGELARDPVKLNLLRTGRIAADAGAILVSVKTGGQGDIVHDLVVAPALMAVIEAVSQGLAGSHVEAKKKELRRKLMEDTKRFAADVYGTRLADLGRDCLSRTGFTEKEINAVLSLPRKLAELETIRGRQ